MKVKLSDTGKAYSGTWDVTQHDSVFTAKVHLIVERGNEERRLLFADIDEMRNFHNGKPMCKCYDEKGIEVWVTGF